MDVLNKTGYFTLIFTVQSKGPSSKFSVVRKVYDIKRGGVVSVTRSMTDETVQLRISLLLWSVVYYMYTVPVLYLGTTNFVDL